MELNQLPLIWEGWKNYLLQGIILSPEQIQVGQKRLASCLNCKYAKESRIRRTINLLTREKAKIQVGQCGICQCSLRKKVLSWASECPLPVYKGVVYPDPQRWGRTHFEDGKLTTPDNVFITEKN